MKIRNFRILPLLIFVALLSLSVRVIEVVQGVDDFSGSAFAEDTSQSDDQSVQKTDADDGDMQIAAAAGDEMSMKADEIFSDEVEAEFGQDQEFPEWRDPSEDDPAYEASKLEVLSDLAARREEIEKKERAVETQMALLQAAEKELDQKYKELEVLRGQIESLLKTQSEEEKERTQSLVKIYEGMKPKDAARIFNTLDLDILVDVAAKMSERKLSPVLAAMNAERARTLTIMLAEQKQLPSLPQ